MNRLTVIHKQYDDIVSSDIAALEKDKALSDLMDQMKREFNIPLLHDPGWEKENKAIIALYRIISESRKTI